MSANGDNLGDCERVSVNDDGVGLAAGERLDLAEEVQGGATGT